jgi:hypothetical protein
MSTNELEKEDEEHKVVPFRPRIITGGRPPDSSDWLHELPIGSIFLSSPKVDPPDQCFSFRIIWKMEDGPIMLVETTTDHPTEHWLNTERFSKNNRLEAWRINDGSISPKAK